MRGGGATARAPRRRGAPIAQSWSGSYPEHWARRSRSWPASAPSSVLPSATAAANGHREGASWRWHGRRDGADGEGQHGASRMPRSWSRRGAAMTSSWWLRKASGACRIQRRSPKGRPVSAGRVPPGAVAQAAAVRARQLRPGRPHTGGRIRAGQDDGRAGGGQAHAHLQLLGEHVCGRNSVRVYRCTARPPREWRLRHVIVREGDRAAGVYEVDEGPEPSGGAPVLEAQEY